MKAIRVYQFGGPEVLQLEETSLVDVLAPNQVLIRVMYAGVNPVETYIRCDRFRFTECCSILPLVIPALTNRVIRQIWTLVGLTYWASRQVIGRDCSQKFPTTM